MDSGETGYPSWTIEVDGSMVHGQETGREREREREKERKRERERERER